MTVSEDTAGESETSHQGEVAWFGSSRRRSRCRCRNIVKDLVHIGGCTGEEPDLANRRVVYGTDESRSKRTGIEYRPNSKATGCVESDRLAMNLRAVCC